MPNPKPASPSGRLASALPAAALTLCALGAPPAAAATFTIDPAHSSVNFKIRHLVSKVAGRFSKFEGTFTYDPKNPKTWAASATIDPASVDTAVAKRDEHLRSADFFDVERCPVMSFKSTRVSRAKGLRAKLHGELTLHCVTKTVVLDLETAGVATDPRGAKRAGATATGKINRKDFGMAYNSILESGGLMLGEDVEISIEIEGIEQAAKGP